MSGGLEYTWGPGGGRGPRECEGPEVRGGLGARGCRGQSEEPCARRESHTGLEPRGPCALSDPPAALSGSSGENARHRGGWKSIGPRGPGSAR